MQYNKSYLPLVIFKIEWETKFLSQPYIYRIQFENYQIKLDFVVEKMFMRDLHLKNYNFQHRTIQVLSEEE